MIRADHRLKGAALLGAAGPGLAGPFGTWPADGPALDDDVQEHGRTAGDLGAAGTLNRPSED
ncbi:hypothetical protein ABZW47_31230 [Streptomyces sp. NPDC004549]|uniref:hypothetical protein n=1 Tax=Streptomyces sp. NPDC004549 TaxID=3154283 RepID=UPI0033B27235